MGKMREAERKVKKQSPACQVRLVEFDFTKTAGNHAVEEYQAGIIDPMAGLDISILINNVGYMVPGDFERVSLEEHKKMIDVGIMPATLITKLLCDQMLNR
jgi:17beta-estradiol 17-dehydrogenase / very-long-chain 3-oxoacyl-CoA reductase